MAVNIIIHRFMIRFAPVCNQYITTHKSQRAPISQIRQVEYKPFPVMVLWHLSSPAPSSTMYITTTNEHCIPSYHQWPHHLVWAMRNSFYYILQYGLIGIDLSLRWKWNNQCMFMATWVSLRCKHGEVCYTHAKGRRASPRRCTRSLSD